MVFVRQISDETQALVRFLKMENKHSLREIAKKVKISKSSVARCLITPNITRKNKRKTNIGRPEKFSVRDRRLLKRMQYTQLKLMRILQ